jgi:hypothetical protein
VSTTPRLGGGFSRINSEAVHANAVSCLSCDWYGQRESAEESCPRCGGGLRFGRPSLRTPRRAKAKSLGQFGVRSEEEEQRTNDALRANREAAQQ